MASLLFVATLVPLGGAVGAQAGQIVPLRAVASEDEALMFARQQSRFEREQSRQHLVQRDGSIERLQSGRAIQRVGDGVLVMRQGWLVRATIDHAGARVAATDSTRLLPTAYRDDWHETLHAWGPHVAVVDHGRGYAALRTYTLLAGGGLAPRDSRHPPGVPPTPLDEVATRQLGSRLLLYTAWRIRSDAHEPAESLVPLSGITEDGEPRLAEPAGPMACERVYRPVAVFDDHEPLSEVRALL
jgi:hypothetical protein